MAAVDGDRIEPVDCSTHEFIVPKKEVKSVEDINIKWHRSQAYRDLLGFIGAMNEEAKNKKLSDPCHMSPTTERLVEMLDKLDTWVDEIPPVDQPQRFGNKAFRDWFKRLQENAESLLHIVLDEKFHKSIPEVQVYLVEGVGNSTRIDYGTGHELSFVAFLCCLFKIGAYTQEDSVAIVCKVFARYIELVRKVQLTYRLEPAGSQGVWNLDDYQFIPFIWGSSQLMDHPRLKPKSFLENDICTSFSKDYMFLGCIQYIHKVKTGPFAEHSNQLWNISGVPTWGKVNQGLIKMYCAETCLTTLAYTRQLTNWETDNIMPFEMINKICLELLICKKLWQVLAKFPIIQHFLFGSLLKISPAES